MALEDLVYTVPEAARALKVSEKTVQRYIARGVLPVMRDMGRRNLISRQDLAHFIEERSGRPDARRGPSAAASPGDRT